MDIPAVEFGVHRDLVCHYSSCFRAALTDDFQEAHAQEVTLETESTDTFKRFVTFVYTQELCKSKAKILESSNCEERTDVGLNQRTIIDIWVFGDRRGVPAMQNKAIHLLHRHNLQAWY